MTCSATNWSPCTLLNYLCKPMGSATLSPKVGGTKPGSAVLVGWLTAVNFEQEDDR